MPDSTIRRVLVVLALITACSLVFVRCDGRLKASYQNIRTP